MTTTTTSDHEAKTAALRATAFGGLSTAQLDDVARVSGIRHVEAGSDLCVQGEFGQEAFVIADGEVCVRVDGTEVARRGRGDIVGDWALFGTGTRTATVHALTDVDVVVVDTAEVDSQLMAVPAAATSFGPQA